MAKKVINGFSRYLRTQEKNSVVAVFHELHPEPIYITRSRWELFTQIKKDPALCKKMIGRKLIVDSVQDDRELEQTQALFENKLDRTSILYLMLTQHCNLSCGYCPIPDLAKKYGKRLMSIEDTKAGVDLWSRHLRDNFDPETEYCVIFYGGEPLLNKKAILPIAGYIKDRIVSGDLPGGIRLILSTNATLVDENVIEICRDLRVTVTVGIDGFNPQQNADRIYSDSGQSLDQVIENIRRLVKGGVTTCASVSITPSNLDSIDDLYNFFRDLGVKKFGFNFLKGRALSRYNGVNEEDFLRQASQKVIRAYEISGLENFEYQMEKKILAFRSQQFYPLDCTCYGSQIVVQPDGQITNCPFYRNDMGHVRQINRDFRIWKTSTVKKWRKRLPLYNQAYANYDAKSLCGGGCAWNNIDLNGKVMEIDMASWIFSEEVFDFLLWSECREVLR